MDGPIQHRLDADDYEDGTELEQTIPPSPDEPPSLTVRRDQWQVAKDRATLHRTLKKPE